MVLQPRVSSMQGYDNEDGRSFLKHGLRFPPPANHVRNAAYMPIVNVP